jgi:hypothetical protein
MLIIITAFRKAILIFPGWVYTYPVKIRVTCKEARKANEIFLRNAHLILLETLKVFSAQGIEPRYMDRKERSKGRAYP